MRESMMSTLDSLVTAYKNNVFKIKQKLKVDAAGEVKFDQLSATTLKKFADLKEHHLLASINASKRLRRQVIDREQLHAFHKNICHQAENKIKLYLGILQYEMMQHQSEASSGHGHNNLAQRITREAPALRQIIKEAVAMVPRHENRIQRAAVLKKVGELLKKFYAQHLKQLVGTLKKEKDDNERTYAAKIGVYGKIDDLVKRETQYYTIFDNKQVDEFKKDNLDARRRPIEFDFDRLDFADYCAAFDIKRDYLRKKLTYFGDKIMNLLMFKNVIATETIIHEDFTLHL